MLKFFFFNIKNNIPDLIAVLKTRNDGDVPIKITEVGIDNFNHFVSIVGVAVYRGCELEIFANTTHKVTDSSLKFRMLHQSYYGVVSFESDRVVINGNQSAISDLKIGKTVFKRALWKCRFLGEHNIKRRVYLEGGNPPFETLRRRFPGVLCKSVARDEWFLDNIPNQKAQDSILKKAKANGSYVWFVNSVPKKNEEDQSTARNSGEPRTRTERERERERE
jgi:hypothetical protein